MPKSTSKLPIDKLKTSALFPKMAPRMHRMRKRPLIRIAKLVVTNGAKMGELSFMKSGKPPG
jgi:hypothetical protein